MVASDGGRKNTWSAHTQLPSGLGLGLSFLVSCAKEPLVLPSITTWGEIDPLMDRAFGLDVRVQAVRVPPALTVPFQPPGYSPTALSPISKQEAGLLRTAQ